MYRQLPGSAVHHPLCVDGRSSWRHCLEGGQLQSSLIFESKNPKKRRTTHLLPLFRVYFWAMIMFSKWALFEIFFNFRTKMYFFFENPAYIFCEKQNYCFAQRFVPIWIIVFSQGKKFILTVHRLRQTRRHGSRYAGQNNSKVSLRKTVYFDLRNFFSRARKTKNTLKKTLNSSYFRLQPTSFLQNRTFISCIIHSFC